jgi:hypothetical protein
MNKALKFTSFLILFSVIAFIGIQAYRFGFNVSVLLGYVLGLLSSGFLPFLDFASLDLFYFLRAFAVLMFMIATALMFFKTLFRGKIIFAFASLSSSLFLLVLVLTSVSEFYPLYPDLSVTESFIAPFISVIDGTNTSTVILGSFIATALFLFSFFAHQISLFVFFVRHPYAKKKTEPLFIESEDFIAQELAKFVVPNKTPTVNNMPSPQSNIPLFTAPTAQQPKVIPSVPPSSIDLSGVIQAKSQVQSLKEKIRLLVRAELQNKVALLPSSQQEFANSEHEKDPQLKQDLGQISSQDSSLEQKLLSYIETNIEKLQPQNKQMIIQMINEELIKYDSLNREAIETLVQERIEQVTQVALDQLKTDVQDAKGNVQTPSSQVSVATLPSSSSESTEEKSSIDVEKLEDLKTELKTFILQSLQESLKPVQGLSTDTPPLEANENSLSPDGKEQLQQLRSELKAYIEQSLRQSSNTSINEEEVKRIVLPLIPAPVSNATQHALSQEEKQTIKEHILASIPVSTQPPLTKEDIIGIIEDRLKGITRTETFNQQSQTVILPPKIKKAVIKAPDNEVRAKQFRSVLPPESDLTRTGKKKIIRVPFYERMAMASPSLRAQYEELKNYLLSYRVKSRLSNAGDMFRLHKEEYAKISIAGKSLKLHLALDPKPYEDTPIPVDDASDKKIYKNIPLVFKVKSNLSVKRARKLIDDLMLQKGQPQKSIPNVAWAQQFIVKK